MPGLETTTPMPTKIKLHQASRKMEIAFNNGTQFELPYESANNEAAGVMMIPVPERGIFHDATGLIAARAVPGVSDIRNTA